MDPLTVTLPLLPLHQAMLVAAFIREAPYSLRGEAAEFPHFLSVTRCLREVADAVAKGRESVILTTSRAALGPLARACQQLAGETYRDNPARPLLLDIATVALLIAAEAA